MIFYLIWIPCEIGVVILSGWLSYKNNHEPRYSLWLYLVGLLQVWVVVSKYSKNLVFDTILYDVIMTFGYVISVAYFTRPDVKLINYVGFLMVIIGMFLFKKGL